MQVWKRASVAVALLALAGTPLAAQSTASATINATAFVAGQQPIAVTGNQDLQFGTSTTPVTAGSGPFTATQTGLLTVTGEPSFPFFVTFTLPSTLADGSGNTINITFNATDGIDWTDFSTSTVFANFDPRTTYTATLSATGVKEIGLNGSINPPLGTLSGTYTAQVVLDVAY